MLISIFGRGRFLASLSAIAVVSVWAWAPALAVEKAEPTHAFLQIEQLEYRAQDGDDAFVWDAEGWFGGDKEKVWFKTEGEQPIGGKLEEAEVQLLYSRLISDFFDVQAGLRHDIKPDPQRTFAVLGLQGLAPYFFEVDAAAFLSNKGELSARLKGEYELLLTQRLILQPSAELNFSATTVEERGIGSGLTDVELGLRLRYEFVREFAPYIGINWERKVGKTADLARDEGEDTNVFSIVAGIRFWF
ncbi:MAG: copper resistance protein B [Alphaproteobacteria bacterium]|nr:copper resistance protein B [Alphaproteobacteria bacterium]